MVKQAQKSRAKWHGLKPRNILSPTCFRPSFNKKTSLLANELFEEPLCDRFGRESVSSMRPGTLSDYF